MRANFTKKQKQRERVKNRKRWNSNSERYCANRRNNYADRNIDLFFEQKENAAKSFAKYVNHPTFDRTKFDTYRADVANLIGKNAYDIEDLEVWGILHLFESFDQTRYATKSDGTVDESQKLASGTYDYLNNMMAAWHTEIKKIEMRTCRVCFERWFHYCKKKKRSDEAYTPCYIEPLDEKRFRNPITTKRANYYSPSEREREQLLSEWHAMFPGSSARPSESLLMITNLVKLNQQSKHVCGFCKHGSTTRIKKHRVCAVKRQRLYCRLNFAIPAPGPSFSNNLTPEEEYIISLCIVAMRIENRLNDPKRSHQSKHSGHACILSLDFAHTYADYTNKHPLPRARLRTSFASLSFE